MRKKCVDCGVRIYSQNEQDPRCEKCFDRYWKKETKLREERDLKLKKALRTSHTDKSGGIKMGEEEKKTAEEPKEKESDEKGSAEESEDSE